jgi:hypothetical protein
MIGRCDLRDPPHTVTRLAGSHPPRASDDEGTGDRPTGWWVHVPVDGPTEAAGIARHLSRFGCRVVAYGARSLLVDFPDASSRADAEAEAGLYLSMWRSAHPSLRAAAPRPHPETSD